MSFEEVVFKGESEQKKRADGTAPVYEPFTPPMVKMITMGATKPPLLPSSDEAVGMPSCYEVNGLRFFAFMHFIDVEERWDVETPLSMCRYVKPEGDMLFNMQACEDATTENARRSLHNKFIVDVFRKFMPLFDCGASANLMTMPQPPESYTFLRDEKIKELKKDRLEYTRKAIEYLASTARKYCGLDYKWEEAWSTADDAAFEATIKERQEKGRVRVRIEGRRPCWWNGVDRRDESGQRVKWIRGTSHTFLTPDLRVVPDDDVDDIVLVENTQVVIAGSDCNTSNPFEKLFAAKTGPRIVLEGEDETADPVPSPNLERPVSTEKGERATYTVEELDD